MMWSWNQLASVRRLDGHGLPIADSDIITALAHIWVDAAGVPYTRESPFGIREMTSLEEIAQAYSRFQGDTRAVMRSFVDNVPVSKATVVLAVYFVEVFRKRQDRVTTPS